MNERPNQVPPPLVNLPDIYYTLFRHKWLILTFSAIGFMLAAFLYFTNVKMYRSEAELLVRYVMETKSGTPTPNDQIKSPDSRGDMIINTETEILVSRDLADEVVKRMGPQKILARLGGGSNVTAAASVILRGLSVEVPRRANVIKLSFQHPDPDVVQPVLTTLINAYCDKHLEIHRTLGLPNGLFEKNLRERKKKLEDDLQVTDAQLRQRKLEANIVVLEDSRKALADRVAKLNDGYYSALAELAERSNLLAKIQAVLPSESSNTNTVQTSQDLKKFSDYGFILDNLRSLRGQLSDCLVKKNMTEINPVVVGIKDQIASYQKQKEQMEKDDPKLANIGIPTSGTNSLTLDPITLKAEIASLEGRIAVLANQKLQVQNEAASLDVAAASISQLQRKKEIDEANYRYLSTSLDQATTDSSLGPGQLPNIGTIEAPTPAAVDVSKLKKYILMILVGAIGGGIGVAFLIELLLDQSVRRTSDVENKLKIPLFLSIPDTSRNGYARKLRSSKQAQTSLLANSVTGGAEIAPWSDAHPLHAFLEALRDRVLLHFEKVTHKPKLVGVCSVGAHAGVTTIASGLAASLSQTGEGNVLLVDLNPQNGAAQSFFHGKPACGLLDSVEKTKREDAQVDENLYLATANGSSNQSNGMLPKRLAGIIPKLQASDYDYIIFDLPPVSRAGLAVTLAGHMDMTLLVIESGKSQRDTVKSAATLLGQVNGKIAAVLNRHRAYVPSRLHQEL